MNIAIHLFFLSIVFLEIIYFWGETFDNPSTVFFVVWSLVNNLASDFSLYHFCIRVNMTSSYTSVLNSLICQIYEIKKNNQIICDPFMIFVKKYVLQYTTTNNIANPKDFQVTTLNTNGVVRIYNKLINNLELTNLKYNTVVSGSNTWVATLYKISPQRHCINNAYYDLSYYEQTYIKTYFTI